MRMAAGPGRHNAHFQPLRAKLVEELLRDFLEERPPVCLRFGGRQHARIVPNPQSNQTHERPSVFLLSVKGARTSDDRGEPHARTDRRLWN